MSYRQLVIDLETATKQEVFDFIAKHLLTQRAQSFAAAGDQFQGCAYRGEHGLMCAAGALIPDSLYEPNMEGDSWTMVIDGYNFPPNHSDLISKLQAIHDNTDPNNLYKILKNYVVAGEGHLFVMSGTPLAWNFDYLAPEFSS